MIRLDYRDARPIYEQVKDGLRRLMVTGVLAPGEKLPSVRSLAMEAGVPSWRRDRSRIWSAAGRWRPRCSHWYRSCGSWA